MYSSVRGEEGHMKRKEKGKVGWVRGEKDIRQRRAAKNKN
jgi:hypothetical protein